MPTASRSSRWRPSPAALRDAAGSLGLDVVDVEATADHVAETADRVGRPLTDAETVAVLYDLNLGVPPEETARDLLVRSDRGDSAEDEWGYCAVLTVDLPPVPDEGPDPVPPEVREAAEDGRGDLTVFASTPPGILLSALQAAGTLRDIGVDPAGIEVRFGVDGEGAAGAMTPKIEDLTGAAVSDDEAAAVFGAEAVERMLALRENAAWTRMRERLGLSPEGTAARLGIEDVGLTASEVAERAADAEDADAAGGIPAGGSAGASLPFDHHTD